MKEDNRNKAMETPETFVPVYYYIHPVTGDILDLADRGKIIIKDEDRHPNSPPYTNSEGETFDVWTGELISRPQEDEEDEQWYREKAAKEARTATKSADLDEEDLPPRGADPHGMHFTDEELEALTATDNDAARALAFATATPEKRALLKAKELPK